jgi:hypothetical protein
MWVKVNGRWHWVAWTDPDYISFHGEMLHKTRCGLLKIRLSYRDFPPNEATCGRCRKLLWKDALA